MTPEQCEEHIQRLRVLWHSQLGQDWVEGRQKQNATIEDVVKALKLERSVAVILGTQAPVKVLPCAGLHCRWRVCRSRAVMTRLKD